MDHQQIERQSQERARVAACDPLTVIGQAKKSLYKGGQGEADPWLDEVVSRFEQQTRAALGSTAFVPSAGTGS